MKTISDNVFAEKIRHNMKEMITNIIIDNCCSYAADLSGITVEFDTEDPTIVHVKLPIIVSTQIQRRST